MAETDSLKERGTDQPGYLSRLLQAGLSGMCEVSGAGSKSQAIPQISVGGGGRLAQPQPIPETAE